MAVVSPTAKAQFIDAAGIPLAGGFLYTYVAGTTTPQATYTDSAASTPNSNPIVLDSRGEANIWLTGASYKFKLTDANGTEIWTVDNIAPPSTAVSPVFTTNVTIADNSPGPALLITQLGAGAAIRVQDETDPDSSPFVVDTTGQVGIGTASPANALDVAGGAIQISTSGGTARTIISADSTDSIFAASDARNFTVKTNSATRLTINATDATSTVPIVLPAAPTTTLQAATKGYVDGLTGAPSGVIMAFAGTAAPTGFLACDGSAVSRTTYAALFAAIGTTWDIGGEGAGNFRLPDLRGMFLRGAGTNATGSSSGAVGQPVSDYAADTYLNHTHTDSGHTHTINIGSSGVTWNTTSTGGSSVFPGYSTTTATGTANIQTSTTGGTETKPKNYGVLYIIKT
jgi:microcystin-dependent protein